MQTMSFKPREHLSEDPVRVSRADEKPAPSRQAGPDDRSDRPTSHHFVSSEKAIELLADAPEIDFEKFRADIYEFVDPYPRNWFED